MKNKKGFTLVELLVVIAILAILATVSIVGYTSFIGKAKESNCLTEATQVRDLIIAEDINNKNFDINSEGKIEIKVETGAGKDFADAKAVVLTTELTKDLGALATGVTIETDGSVTYKTTEYEVKFNFKDAIPTPTKITTD